VSERDYGSFGALMDEHYVSDDTNVRLLARCILTAYAGSVWRISSHRNRPTLRLLPLHDDAERGSTTGLGPSRHSAKLRPTGGPW